jgi:NADH:ubiquinone oxidoreductase subunit 4 (chain M)
MGFVILGVFSFNELAYQGVVIQMVAHGISTGALFILVGQLYARIHTRDINRMGGLWEKVPVMGAIGLVFSMASLGLPGLGNFVAELLILIGVFKANVLMSCLASLGLIAATIYSLRIVQKVFLGKKNTDWTMNDLTIREKVVSASLVIAILWLGLFPKPVLEMAKPAILKTLNKQKEISYEYPGSNFEKILCEPSCNPLCTFVVKNNSFNHKGTQSKTQSNTKEEQDN